jgi:hypothetical protein
VRISTPALYLISYLVIILAFTAVYLSLGPRNFYDSAITHEDIFPQERARFNDFIGALLAEDANTGLTNREASAVFLSHIHPYQVQSRELNSGIISGFLTYVITDYPAAGNTVACDFDFDLDTTQLWTSNYDTGSSKVHKYVMMWPTSQKRPGVGRIRECDTDLDLLSMFPEGETKFGLRYRPSKEMPIYIPLNGDEVERFSHFGLAFEGDPYYLSHDFQRMFYFSATTITTVGFGDILPISETARVLSGTEAILGWIIAGLFINAVTRRPNNDKAAEKLPRGARRRSHIPEVLQ